MKKNGNINLIKFLMAIVLVIFHAKAIPYTDSASAWFARGQLAVEVFFIISGFFMARNADTKAESTACYIIRKFRTILPWHLFAFFFAFLTKIYVSHPEWINIAGGFYIDIKKIGVLILGAIPEFLLLPPMAGLQYDQAGILGNEWYLGAMLLGMALIYPFIKKWTKQFCTYAAPLIFIFFSGYLSLTKGSYFITYGEINNITGGLLRAIAGMSIGTTIYWITNHVSLKENSILKNRLVVTIIEVISWALFFGYLNSSLANKLGFSMIYLAIFGLIFSFSGYSYLSQPLANGFISFLAELSLPIYLNQGWIRKLLIKFDPQLTYWYTVLLFASLTAAVSMVNIVIVKLIRKAVKNKKQNAL